MGQNLLSISLNPFCINCTSTSYCLPRHEYSLIQGIADWSLIYAGYEYFIPINTRPIHSSYEGIIIWSDKKYAYLAASTLQAGLQYSGNEPPISSLSLLPKSHYNLVSLLISLDQGHIEIVPQLMVHVCPELSNPKPQAASTLWKSHWWFTCAPSIFTDQSCINVILDPFHLKHVERLPFWFLVLKQNPFFHASMFEFLNVGIAWHQRFLMIIATIFLWRLALFFIWEPLGW